MRRILATLPLVLGTVLLQAPGSGLGIQEDGSEKQVAELEAQINALQEALRNLQKKDTAGEILEKETSVKPGINDSWKSDEIGPLIRRLETESREIFTYRAEIAAAVGPLPGMAIADIGAGSGFMSHIFAHQVGEKGKVYAVDINQRLMEHVAIGAKAKQLKNIETIVCTEKSVELPPESVDIIYVCDTYHHFEYPMNTMASIHRALKPHGQLVIVDFHRIPGVSRDWILGHVRAGQEVFTKEIVDSGFALTNVHSIPSLQENYIIRFRKVDKPR